MRPTVRIACTILATACTSYALPALADGEGKTYELRPAGEPVNCITAHRIDYTRVKDDKTIDFYMLGNDIYRNTLPHKCPSLGFEERFSYKLSTSQLCSVDIIYVLHSFGGGLQQGAGCGLGQFQPMEKVKIGAEAK